MSIERIEGATERGASIAMRHVKLTLLGLVVILVPAMIALKSIQHAHKMLHSAFSTLAPGLRLLGGVGAALAILAILLFLCWLLGWIVSRTELGQRVLAWEKARYMGRSPLMQKVAAKQEAGTPQPVAEAIPALADIQGGWQPCVIVGEPTDEWATLFVPEVPNVTAGRLVCLPRGQVLPLETPLDDFRKKLTESGHGSEDWLNALKKAQE